MKTILPHVRIVVAMLLLCGALQGIAHAAPKNADETQVKAAFLYKFLGYVEWPPRVFASADTALIVGVMDDEALADNLTLIAATRTVGSRPVVVRKLRHGDSLGGLHALFIGRAAEARLGDILVAAKGQPILTVTESAQGLTLGSNINFIVVDNRLRFDVAPPPATADGMKISARLLAVARKVMAGSS